MKIMQNYGDINAHHPKRSFKRDPDSESTTLTTTKLNFIIRVGNHLAMVGVAPLHKVVNPSSCKFLVNFG